MHCTVHTAHTANSTESSRPLTSFSMKQKLRNIISKYSQKHAHPRPIAVGRTMVSFNNGNVKEIKLCQRNLCFIAGASAMLYTRHGTHGHGDEINTRMNREHYYFTKRQCWPKDDICFVRRHSLSLVFILYYYY